MAEQRPRLVAVEEPSAAAPVRPARGGSRLVLAIAVLALVCAVGWLLSSRESRRLEAELAAVQSELAGAQEKLAVIESQRIEARAQLQALAAEANVVVELIRGLDQLLATDPASAIDAQPMGNEAEPRD
jgi:hypothetical protein